MSKAESYEALLKALGEEANHKIMRADIRPRKAGVTETCRVCGRPFRDAERLLSVMPAMSGGPYTLCTDRKACRDGLRLAKQATAAQEKAHRNAIVDAVTL